MFQLTEVRKRLALEIYRMPHIPKTIRIRASIVRKLRVQCDSVPPNATPYVVLGTARSGSSLLCERLSSTWRTIRNDQEILNTKVYGERSFDVALRNTYFTDSGHRIIGCKVLAAQVSDAELQAILSLPNQRVVLLRRENLVRQYVSREIANQDNVWVQSKKSRRSEVSSRRVRVVLDDLLEYQAKLDKWYQRFEEFIRDIPVTKVTYEDLVADLDGEIRRIGEFLGAGEPDRVAPPRLKKQNPEPLRDLIENFEELRDALQNGGHTDLLAFMVD